MSFELHRYGKEVDVRWKSTQLSSGDARRREKSECAGQRLAAAGARYTREVCYSDVGSACGGRNAVVLKDARPIGSRVGLKMGDGGSAGVALC